MKITTIKSLNVLKLEKEKTESPKEALRTGGQVWMFRSLKKAGKHHNEYSRARCRVYFRRKARWVMVVMTFTYRVYKLPKLENLPLSPDTSCQLLKFIPELEKALENVQGQGQIWILRSQKELGRAKLPEETKAEALEALKAGAGWVIVNKSPDYEVFSDNLGPQTVTFNYNSGGHDSIH